MKEHESAMKKMGKGMKKSMDKEMGKGMMDEAGKKKATPFADFIKQKKKGKK